MSKQYFMPRNEADKKDWLQNFANKLGGYATKYNITAPEVADMGASYTYYDYWVNYSNQYGEYIKKLTQYRNELKDGIEAGATASVQPVPPTMGVVPTAVNPGIFKRAVSIAGVIKKRSNYTEADGMDLGIEGSEAPQQRINDAKPTISLQLVQGGKPEVVWSKEQYDGIDIYVDRGTGVFAFLATDTYPNYIDTFTLPASGTSALWKYKTIYRYNDVQVGQWSDIVVLAVGG